MTWIKLLLFLPYFYTQLLAWSDSRKIPFMVGIAALTGVTSGFRSWKSGRRSVKAAAGLIAAYAFIICIGLILVPFAKAASTQWFAWFDAGCGVRVGMTKDQVVASLKSRATVDDQMSRFGTYSLSPRGLAAMKPMDIDIHEVTISTDSAGLVASFHSSSYF